MGDLFADLNSYMNDSSPNIEYTIPPEEQKCSDDSLNISTSSLTLPPSPTSEKKSVKPRRGQILKKRMTQTLRQRMMEEAKGNLNDSQTVQKTKNNKTTTPKRNSIKRFFNYYESDNSVDGIDEPMTSSSIFTTQSTEKGSATNSLNIISIDSDDENASNNSNVNSSFNSSIDGYDVENCMVSIKINWMGKIKLMQLRKYQKFHDLMEELSKEQSVPVSDIVLNLNNKVVYANDTPASIGYTIGKFIFGRIVQGKQDMSVMSKKDNKRKTSIDLKIQSSLWKKPLIISIEKTDKMIVVLIKCAEELKCDPEKIKLNFDGEPLNLKATVDEMELDGGEVIDLRMV